MFTIKPSSDPLIFNILAARIGYFIAGFGLSIWAPLVPYVRLNIPMTDATFGFMLLCIGMGSISCMPLSAALTTRFNIRHCLFVITLILLGALVSMTLASSLWVLGLALFLFGVITLVTGCSVVCLWRQHGCAGCHFKHPRLKH